MAYRRDWASHFKTITPFAYFQDEEKHSEVKFSLLKQDSFNRLFKHSWKQLKPPGPDLSSWAASDWLPYSFTDLQIYRTVFFFCVLQAFLVKGVYNSSGAGVVISPPKQRVEEGNKGEYEIIQELHRVTEGTVSAGRPPVKEFVSHLCIGRE